MLTKLQTFREENEDAFTLIELLVVILIIGILSSIAIPVFLNQRKTANDATVESDVKNAATAVESWIVGQKGADKEVPDLGTLDVKMSEGVSLRVTGTSNEYCVLGAHENGKNHLQPTPLTYDNAAGGLGKSGPACAGQSLPIMAGSNEVVPDFSAGVRQQYTFGHALSNPNHFNFAYTWAVPDPTIKIDNEGRVEVSAAPGALVHKNWDTGEETPANGEFTLRFAAWVEAKGAEERHDVKVTVTDGAISDTLQLPAEFVTSLQTNPNMIWMDGYGETFIDADGETWA